MLRRRDAGHRVRLLEERDRPQPGEREVAAPHADVDEEARPRVRIREHGAQRTGPPDRRRRRRGADLREPELFRPIADAPPCSEREQRRQRSERDEDGTPRRMRDDPGERRPGDDRAEIPGEHRHADDRGEAVGGEPQRADLQDRDEGDRHADAHQRATRRGDAPCRRDAEQQRAGGGDQRSGHEDPARSQRVGENADRDLQRRVDVEVRRRERAEDCAADVERARKLAGDRRRRRSMKEREQVARERDAEDDASRRDETRIARHGALDSHRANRWSRFAARAVARCGSVARDDSLRPATTRYIPLGIGASGTARRACSYAFGSTTLTSEAP